MAKEAKRRAKIQPAQKYPRAYEVRLWTTSRYGADNFRIFGHDDLESAETCFAKAEREPLLTKVTLTQNEPHKILRRAEREA